jgi:hypothetical protein
MQNNEQLLKYFERYRREVKDGEIDSREFSAWLIHQRLWEPPIKTQMDILMRELGAALRAQTMIVDGRKVRRKHCVRRKIGMKEDKPLYQTVWADIDVATPQFMEASFHQRRDGLVNKACQLNNDVYYYNEYKNPAEPIQMLFDLTDDVADRQHSYESDDDEDDFDEDVNLHSSSIDS